MNTLTHLWLIFWVTFMTVTVIDLIVVTRRRTGITVGYALRWTGLWVAVALGFAAVIYHVHPEGATLAPQYLAGYLTEYSLSVDNLFVFILIFSLMGVREAAQPKLIKLAIYLSIVLRIAFIFFGLALVSKFHWLIYALGLLLLWTGWKMIVSDEEAEIRPESNLFYRVASRIFRIHQDDPSSRRLIVTHCGKLCITPLFLATLVIGSVDVMFAFDSIPAIMGITQDPFIAVTADVFAVMGLNSLFFAVQGIMKHFHYLKHGVSVILLFIGAKMIAGIHRPIEEWFHAHTFVSLAVIGTILLSSILFSIWHHNVVHHQPCMEET